MKQKYIVRQAFRVGADQRWLMPGETVELLPCEVQYPLSRDWLEPEPVEQKPAASAAKKKD